MLINTYLPVNKVWMGVITNQNSALYTAQLKVESFVSVGAYWKSSFISPRVHAARDIFAQK